jgi:hypothetical protein
MENASVATQIAAKGAAFRVQESLMNLLVDAVYSFYFAKRACPALDAFATGQAGHLEMGVREVRNSSLPVPMNFSRRPSMMAWLDRQR